MQYTICLEVISVADLGIVHCCVFGMGTVLQFFCVHIATKPQLIQYIAVTHVVVSNGQEAAGSAFFGPPAASYRALKKTIPLPRNIL